MPKRKKKDEFPVDGGKLLDVGEGPNGRKRRKIVIDYIRDKSRRQITFSKRKAGLMKKAYELTTLTGTEALLLVASQTGHVYTFATQKLRHFVTVPEGKALIQACLNAPDPDESDGDNDQDEFLQQERYLQQQHFSTALNATPNTHHYLPPFAASHPSYPGGTPSAGPVSRSGLPTKAPHPMQASHPIQGPASHPIQGPASHPIQGPASHPMQGPASHPIQGPASHPMQGGPPVRGAGPGGKASNPAGGGTPPVVQPYHGQQVEGAAQSGRALPSRAPAAGGEFPPRRVLLPPRSSLEALAESSNAYTLASMTALGGSNPSAPPRAPAPHQLGGAAPGAGDKARTAATETAAHGGGGSHLLPPQSQTSPAAQPAAVDSQRMTQLREQSSHTSVMSTQNLTNPTTESVSDRSPVPRTPHSGAPPGKCGAAPAGLTSAPRA